MFFSLAIFFVVGSAVGSFLNVVIDRSVRSESLLGRSYCDWCKARLSALDLVPIASFVALRARCRYCKRPISWQYPLVEVLSGLLFAFSFYYLASLGILQLSTLLFYFFVLAIFLVVAVVDLKYSLIPTSFVYLASLVVLFYNYLFLPTNEFITSVIAGFVLALFFLAIVVVTRGRGMGSGDIPLVFLIGLVCGWPRTITAVFVAFIAGALAALLLIFLGRKKFGQTIPFGPFLVFGTIVALFWGIPLIDWYLGLIS